jgi:hypothetical protein
MEFGLYSGKGGRDGAVGGVLVLFFLYEGRQCRT